MFRHAPLVQDAIRLGASARVEAADGARRHVQPQLPWLVKGIERLGRAFIRSQVHDPVLREQLTPQLRVRVQAPDHVERVLRDVQPGQHAAGDRPDRGITEAGIRTADGITREIDTLVLATGYQTTEPENAPPIPIVGRGRSDLGVSGASGVSRHMKGVVEPRLPERLHDVLARTRSPGARGCSWSRTSRRSGPR